MKGRLCVRERGSLQAICRSVVVANTPDVLNRASERV